MDDSIGRVIDDIERQIDAEEARESDLFSTINGTLSDSMMDTQSPSFKLNRRESVLLQESVGVALEEGQDVMNLLFSPATKAMVEEKRKHDELNMMDVDENDDDSVTTDSNQAISIGNNNKSVCFSEHVNVYSISPPPPPSESADSGSNGSEGSTVRDLDSAKKAVANSSNQLALRLQEAAQRRKVFLSRRRNSMKAATERAMNPINAPPSEFVSNDDDAAPRAVNSSSSTSFKPFKARPLPVSSSDGGSGGYVGVPKVEKRPTTTPVSPMVGKRRSKRLSLNNLNSANNNNNNNNNNNTAPVAEKKIKKNRRMTISAGSDIRSGMAGRERDQAKKRPTPVISSAAVALPIPPYNSTLKKQKLDPSEDPYVPFKAKPLPKTTGNKGAGGIVGVPRVSKRTATVPNSPKLGARRTDMGNFAIGVDSSNLKFNQTYGAATKQQKRGLSNRNTNINVPRKTSGVKKSALNAKPFERNLGGEQASSKIKAAIDSQKEVEESMIACAQNSFVARPLPVTTMKPQILTNKSILGYDDENYSGNGNSNISALTDNADETIANKPANKSIRSTIRAVERQAYNNRRDRSTRSRKAKLEMTLNKLAEVTRGELATLQEQMKEVLPTAGMR